MEEEEQEIFEEAPPQIELGEMLQNLLMHVVMSANLPEKVYKKVSRITPDSTSTTLMAEA